MWCRCRQDVDWQRAIFGLDSGTRIQIYGDWLKDKLLGLFPYLLIFGLESFSQYEFFNLIGH